VPIMCVRFAPFETSTRMKGTTYAMAWASSSSDRMAKIASRRASTLPREWIAVALPLMNSGSS
jgi:hypothetical protein